jgi:protein O-mannosyl-transferase
MIPFGRAFRRSDLAWAGLLFVATLIVYAPALHGELLLDDDVHLTRPELQTLAGLARIWTDVGATQQYYPVLHTAFWLEHRLWGDAVFGYHLTNVLLHIVAALLVVACMRQLRIRGEWLAAFLFALHPMSVESVAWISEQKNTLSAAFALGATWLYLRFSATRRRSQYALATLLFVLAVLSKTSVVVLPAVLLVVLWWRDGRLSARRDVAPIAPWLAVAVAFALVTLRVERQLIAEIDAQLALPFFERALLAARAVCFYAQSLLWPANLSFFYERWVIDASSLEAYGYGAAVLIMAAALILLARQMRGPLAAFFSFGILLFPVLGFFDVEWFVFSFVADHFVYLASIAFAIALAGGLAGAAQRWPFFSSRAGHVVAISVVGTFAWLTWRHSAAFHDNVRLYTEAVARSPGSVVAHHHLAVALAEDKVRMAEAMAEFAVALRLNPDAAEVHESFGLALLRIPEESSAAVQHLETALRLKPTLRLARAKLATVYFERGKLLASGGDAATEAISAYERALEMDPQFTEAHYNLGNALLKIPARLNDAIAHYEAAIRLKPDFVEAHTNFGTVLAKQPGRLPEAIAHFEAALRASPDYAPARNNLTRARQLLEGGARPISKVDMLESSGRE